ncbi:MAG: DUF11 domain-containing protein [Planctomycetes bacterium]|nr:DUF11 domain-containing protein [Planctomycetota bacterium]
MKRLLVRLALLSVLVAAGVFAIAQSQGMKPTGDDGQNPPELPPQVSPQASSPVAAETPPSAASPLASLIPLPAQYGHAGGDGQYVMPAPSPPVVRGNNADEGDSEGDEPTEEGFASAQADAPSQPPASHLAQADGAASRPSNPFGRSAGYEQSGTYEPAAPVGGGEGEVETSDSGMPTPTPEADAASGEEYQEFSIDAASGAQSLVAPETEASGPTPADPQPAPLGAPRELTPYSGGSDAGVGGYGYEAPKPIGGPAPGTGQESGVRGQESGVGDQESRFSFEQAPRSGAPAPGYGHVAGVEGSGAPGPQHLEGAQTPSVTLKKIAPPEIQVGKPVAFEIEVRNVGRIAAHQVIVKEEIPRGVQFIDAAPPANPQSGALMWELGTLQAGESRQIKIQYMPIAEGDVGSVAVAAFQAQASVRTVCTRPQLTIEQSAPEKVLVGQSFNVRIRLSNPGTGVANRVVLEEDVPDGFAHPSGKALEYEVGALRPGESRDLDLTLKAAKAGVWDNLLVVRGEGNLAVEHGVKVEVVAPQLELAMTGPTRRYLERQATYVVAVANPGTATANDVKLVGRLPKGMKFVAANNEGQYDPNTHVVQWSLAELPPGQVGQVQFTALPVETGDQKIVVEGEGELDVAAQAEHAVAVEALAELAFEIADQADPIEINKETIYEVKVTNKGSKTATNIRVSAVFPPDMKPLAGDGPARAGVSGNRVLFEPLARLNPREQATFRIQAQGLRAGDQRIQVQIVSDDSPTPVTKEESTRIYSDR